MANKQLIDKVTHLESMLEKFVVLYKEALTRNEELEEENTKLNIMLEDKREEINNFKNRVKISKIVDTLSLDENNPTFAKTKLNEYIEEVDQCIAYLRKQV